MKTVRRPRRPPWIIATMLLALAGCSAQPMTLDQELVATGIAGGIGAVSGAIFAAASGKGYPASVGIGAGGMAGAVLIYEEVKREAALESAPPPPPIESGAPSPINPNP